MLNFHTDDTSAWTLSNEDLVAAIRWRRTRGAHAAKAAETGPRAFTAWLRGSTALPAWTVSGQAADPLWQTLWSRTAFSSTGRSETLAGVVELFCTNKSKRNRDKMLRMLFNEFDAEQSPNPFELLVLATLLQTRRSELTDETLLGLFKICILSARDLALEVDTTPPRDESSDQHLVRRGELPLLISHVFESVQGASHLRKHGRETMIRLIEEETDTDGTPHGRMLERLPLFVAAYTRTLSRHADESKPILKQAGAKRFTQLVSQTALLAGSDGRPALASTDSFSPASLLHTACRVANLPKRDPGMRAVEAIQNDAPNVTDAANPKAKSKGSCYSVESDQSEWGGIAIFRGDFSKPKFHGVVDFHGTRPRLEISLNGQPVLSGCWDVETRVGGVALPEPDGWSVVCWFSDEEADYIELQAELGNGVRLTRHVMYANDDNLLILSASVQNAGEGTVESVVRLPVVESLDPARDEDNRLVKIPGKTPVRVIPLGLEADPFAGTAGQITVVDHTIEVQQANAADGLCVPIAIDLNAKGKQRRPLDWQRLTVAENGRPLPRGIADAWRLRIGAFEDSPQWVYYQGLSQPQFNRTVLGLHTPYEMVFGRFEDGEIDPLVHVESE